MEKTEPKQIPGASVPDKKTSAVTLILKFLKGSKGLFLLSIFFAATMSFLELVNPRLIAYTVDSVLGDREPDLPRIMQRVMDLVGLGDPAFLRPRLYLIAIAVIVVALLSALCRYLFRTFNSRAEERMVRNMRERLYDHIIHLPITWHNRNQTGDIIQRCTSDVDTIRNFLSEQLVTLVRVIILIVLAIWFMAGVHVGLTVVAVLLVPFIIGYSLYFHNKIGESFQHVDEMEGRLSAMAQENLAGVRVVRAFGREKYEKDRFEKMNETYMNTWIHLMKLLSRFWALGDLTSGLQVMLIVLAGAILCVRGELTAGEYIAFISYNAMLTWPVRMLGRVISDMSKAGISIERIRYIIDSVPEEPQAPVPERVPDFSGDITFDHVSFGYEQEEVLRDVSFTLPGGRTLGILGGTGSGKSTLVQLLDRLYDLDADQGAIRIDGVDIRELPRKVLREHVGMVLQEPFLFSGSLEENILLTLERGAGEEQERKEYRQKRLHQAASVAALEDTVRKFAKGYDTYVGERGVTLSGGQKQRTAIAQVLVSRPPIMIFDDSLSAVDAQTDAYIRKQLQKTQAGTTTILISHRISTLMKADLICVLDHGRVAELGTHAQLMEKGGIYRQIYDLQKPEM